MTDKHAIISRCPLFAGFDEVTLSMFATATVSRKFETGARIYDDQSFQNCLSIIESGVVALTAFNDEGKETVLAILEDGAWFGDSVFSPGLPRVLNADARTEVSLLELPGDLFRQVLAQDAKAALHVIDCLGRRFWGLMSLFQDDAVHSVQTRLLRRLVLMSQFRFAPTDADHVTIKMTQDDLAALMGMTRQGLRPTLRALEADDLMRFSYGVIELPSLARLDQYLKEQHSALPPDTVRIV